MKFKSLLRAMVVLMLLTQAAPLAARTYIVGLGGSANGCTHSSLATAIAAARNNAGPDEIRLVQGMTDTNQSLFIEGQDLTITGGYENCADPDVSLERTVVSGEGGTRVAVFTVHGPGVVRLENLQIVAGDSAFEGGGILYIGSTVPNSVNALVLTRTVVDGNRSDRGGGGISFSATGGQLAELVLEQDTGFFRNIAQGDGGAMHLSGNMVLTAEAQRLFFWDNRSFGGSGGAIYLKQPARAQLGGASWLGVATFLRNIAQLDGGAVHVAGNNDASAASMQFYSFLPDQPLSFEGNVAGRHGGAFSVDGLPSLPLPNASLCVRNVNLINNMAEDGSAVYADSAEYGHCPSTTFPASAPALCTPHNLCNVYAYNTSSGADTSAALTFVGAIGDIRQATLRDNAAGFALLRVRPRFAGGQPSPGAVSVSDSVLRDTLFFGPGSSVLHVDDATTLTLAHVTMTGHRAGTALGESFGSRPRHIVVQNSIVYEPDVVAFSSLASANLTLDHALVFPSPSNPPNASDVVLVGDPLFRNSELELSATSPALDVAPTNFNLLIDRFGRPRPVDLASRPNWHGAADLGAFEAQSDGVDSVFSNQFEDER